MPTDARVPHYELTGDVSRCRSQIPSRRKQRCIRRVSAGQPYMPMKMPTISQASADGLMIHLSWLRRLGRNTPASCVVNQSSVQIRCSQHGTDPAQPSRFSTIPAARMSRLPDDSPERRSDTLAGNSTLRLQIQPKMQRPLSYAI